MCVLQFLQSLTICFIPTLTLVLYPRAHPALVRVKEEDHEEISLRPGADSQISAGFQPSASNVLSSAASPRQQPHGSQTHAPTFMRESVGDMFRSGAYRKSPAPFVSSIETTGTSLPKKRRVTISGADAPSTLRSLPLIPTPLRGLNSSATPETIAQLRNALQVKHQQKALISARRAGNGGATPEPSSLSSSFVQTHMPRPSDLSGSQASFASLTSPISPWDSSDVAGLAHSFTSTSTVPNERASTSSPSQDASRSPHIRSRKARQTIAGPSSSTMAAALDIEMEVEEGQSEATQVTRRRTQSSVLPTTAAGAQGVSSSGSSSASPRGKVASRLAVRPTIAEMERRLDSQAARFTSGGFSPSTGNSIPPRPVDLYETDTERSVYGQAGGIGSPGGPIRHSHSSPRLFRSPPTGGVMPDVGPSGRPDLALSQSQSHSTSLPRPPSGYFRLDTESARLQSRSYRDDDNTQSGQSGFTTPSLPGVQAIQSGFSFSRSGGAGDGMRSRRASFVVTPQTPTSTHFTSRSPVAEMPQTRFPPPTSFRAGPTSQQRPPFVSSEPSSANPEFPPSASGTDQIISRDRFVSLFEGIYDSMVDARRVRAWIEEQQSIRAAEASSEPPSISIPSSNNAHDNLETPRAVPFGGASYVRAEEVQSIIDARVEVVRRESRREIENLLHRVNELEKRVEEKLEPEEHQGSATPAALAPPLAPLTASANGSEHASARTTPVNMAGEMDVDHVHVDGDKARQDA